ncbi:MAG: hypothetical protein ACXWVD_00285 [Telluria sp.]
MKKAPPNLVMQEPTATGWQRTEIYGNAELGRSHVHDARTVLGALRSQAGVNERIAAGEAGGFYHRWAMLPDGTRVHAITNDGHDTVRIYSPGHKSEPVEEKPVSEPSGTPYMWVGVRTRYDKCRTDRWALTVNMVEPNTGQYRGILCDNYIMWCAFAEIMEEGDKIVRAREDVSYPTPGGQPNIARVPDDWTVQELMQEHHGYFMGEGSQPYTIQRQKQLRDHNFWIHSLDDDEYFYCSANGLRLYSSEASDAGAVGTVEGVLPAERWGPYDPLMDEAQNGGEGRDTTGMIAEAEAEVGLSPADVVRGWDRVFVLDPFEDAVQPPCDGRPHILAASKALYEAGMARGIAQILAGEYMLTVSAMGEVIPESDRAGERVPIEHDPPLSRSQYGDYLEHIVPTDYTLPLVVEVEVRLGKMAQDTHPDTKGMSVYTFELTCEDYHNYENVSLPFGYGEDADYDPCYGYPGMNPLGPNYSDFIAIDVNARTARLVPKSEVDLAPVFGGGGHYKPLDGGYKTDLDLYICGDIGVSQVDQDEYAIKAAAAIYDALEVFTSGAYLNMFVNLTYRSVADLITACRDIQKGHVWLYNVMSNTITALPLVDSTDAMKADTRYKDWMSWYYPYRKQSRAACRAPAAILLQAGPEYVYDWSGGYGPDDTEDYGCCG